MGNVEVFFFIRIPCRKTVLLLERYFVYREGHITSSRKALEMYFQIARSPYVKNVCEVGFNAGHSTAIFLNANPKAKIWSWDLGQKIFSIDVLNSESHFTLERVY